jgi:hypothetical protein
VPEGDFAPDQSPDAVQELALVEDQASVEEPRLGTAAGLAASDTVGADGACGGAVTATCAVALALPLGPIQLREKSLFAPRGPVDSAP